MQNCQWNMLPRSCMETIFFVILCYCRFPFVFYCYGINNFCALSLACKCKILQCVVSFLSRASNVCNMQQFTLSLFLFQIIYRKKRKNYILTISPKMFTFYRKKRRRERERERKYEVENLLLCLLSLFYCKQNVSFNLLVSIWLYLLMSLMSLVCDWCIYTHTHNYYYVWEGRD